MTGGLVRIHEGNLAGFERTGRLLNEGLQDVRDFYQKGMPPHPLAMPVLLIQEQMIDWLTERVCLLNSWLQEMVRLVNADLCFALQAPMSEQALKAACDRLIELGHCLVAWEQDAAKHLAPTHWEHSMQLLQGMTLPVAQTLFQIVDGITGVAPRVQAGETNLDLTIQVPSMPRLVLLRQEMNRASRASLPFHIRHPILAAIGLRAFLSS